MMLLRNIRGSVHVLRSGLFVNLVLLLSSCSNADKTQLNPISHDMAELMKYVLEPAAERIWDSSGWIMTMEGDQDLTPTDDEGWLNVTASAVTLIESTQLLASEELAVDQEEWIEFLNALIQVSDRIKQLSIQRKATELFDAGGHLYNVCRACHQQYWESEPIRPSER